MKAIVTIWSILLPMAAYAQQCWSLGDCIAYAHSHNITVLEQDINIEESKVSGTAALLAMLPQLNFSGGRNDVWYGENSGSHAWEATFEGSWVVFDSFSRYNTLLSRRLNTSAARLADEALRGEISLRVTESYLKIMLSAELLECAREEYSSICKEKERVEALVEVGSAPLSSLYTVESQCAGEYADVVKAECDLKSSKMALFQLLNLPYDESFTAFCTIADSLPKPPEFSYAEIVTLAGKRPEIRRLSVEEQARRKSEVATKCAAVPYIALSAEHIGSELYPGGKSSAIELQLVVPILDGGAAYGAIRRSSLEHRRSSLEKERGLVEMTSTIQSAFLEAGNLYNMALAGKARLSAAKALLSSSEAKFRSGSITAAEFAVSRSDYLSARGSEISARWQYLFQLKIADYYRGIPIEL